MIPACSFAAAYYFREFSRSALEENLRWEAVELWREFGDRKREDRACSPFGIRSGPWNSLVQEASRLPSLHRTVTARISRVPQHSPPAATMALADAERFGG